MDGGPGSDTADYSTEPAGVIVHLAKHASLEPAGQDSSTSVESLTGSRFDEG